MTENAGACCFAPMRERTPSETKYLARGSNASWTADAARCFSAAQCEPGVSQPRMKRNTRGTRGSGRSHRVEEDGRADRVVSARCCTYSCLVLPPRPSTPATPTRSRTERQGRERDETNETSRVRPQFYLLLGVKMSEGRRTGEAVFQILERLFGL